MPEVNYSPTEVAYPRVIRHWQYPLPRLHLFNDFKNSNVLNDRKRGRSLCGIRVSAIDPVISDKARLRLCKRCFKGQQGYAVLGWVVTVTTTEQQRLEVDQ